MSFIRASLSGTPAKRHGRRGRLSRDTAGVAGSVRDGPCKIPATDLQGQRVPASGPLYLHGVRFSILGSIGAWRDGVPVSIGGPKQRALLAVLLINANRPVSRDRLIEALWGESPPPSAQQSLDTYLSRLRRQLGGERVIRRPPGYLLEVGAGELDADLFVERVTAGRERLAAGHAGQAAALLREALALWRGPALADVLGEPFARAESNELEERRLAALEDRIEADLNAGVGADLIAEVEGLVRVHPLRERLVGQLMVSLYAAGRQAEALTVFQAARHRLAEELGIEPGPQLCELQRRILRHDLTLPRGNYAAPSPKQPVSVGPGDGRQFVWRRSRLG